VPGEGHHRSAAMQCSAEPSTIHLCACAEHFALVYVSAEGCDYTMTNSKFRQSD
jgi:hypothetical protein